MTGDISNRVQAVFRRVFQDPELNISTQDTARDIPGWDSLTHMTLIATLEETFSITFSFQEVNAFRDVGDIISAVHRKTSQKPT